MKKQRLSTKRLHSLMEHMTDQRINQMVVLERERYFRLLQDRLTGFYVVFNGYLYKTYYCKSFQMAKRFFDQQLSLI